MKGFTLIELTVVVMLMSVILLFSFPMIRNISLFNSSAGQEGDIIRLINDLKKRAVARGIDHTLHLDAGAGLLWVTDESMTGEDLETAKQNAFQLSEDIVVMDVQYPGGPGNKSGAGEYRIRFRKEGYSDFVLLHIMNNGNAVTLKVEPFLAQVDRLEEHVGLEDCI